MDEEIKSQKINDLLNVTEVVNDRAGIGTCVVYVLGSCLCPQQHSGLLT